MIKKVLAIVMMAALLLVLLAMPASAKTFSDVREGHWAENAIDRWSDLGVITGDPNGKFRPGDPLTRREFAVITSNLFGPAESTVNPFEDVENGKWYTAPILSANAKGWMVGDVVGGKLYFRPKGFVTRQQVFCILARGLGIPELTDEDEIQAQLDKFTDGDQVSSWARGQIAALIKLGMVTGPDENVPQILPKHNATRATVMVILDNLTGNGIDDKTDKYVDRKQYIDKGGVYDVTDVGYIVIKTNEPVTLRAAGEEGVVSNIVVAPGSSGGNLKIIDTKVGGDVLVDADNYNVVFENSKVGGNVLLNGDNDTVTVNEGSSLEKATANGKNATVEGGGEVKAVEANGNYAQVTTPGTKVTARQDLDEDGKPVKDKDGNPTGAKGVKAGDKTVVPGTTETVENPNEQGGTVAPVPYNPGTVKTYRVTFDGNGSTTKIPAQNVEAGKFAVKPETDPELDGYLFLGWFEKEEIEEGDKPFDFAKTEINGSLTLFAQWKKAAFAVTVVQSDMVGTDVSRIAKPKVTVSDTTKGQFNMTLEENEPFVLYAETTDFDHDTDQPGHFVAVKLMVGNADITDTTPVTIPEGATITYGEKTVPLTKEMTLVVNLDEHDAKTGAFTFVIDWNDGTSEKVILAQGADGQEALPIGWMLTLVDGKFDNKAYEAIIDVEGGKPLVEDSLPYPGDTTYVGYEFIGWFKDADRSVAWVFEGDDADVVTGNTTIYADWELLSYEVTYDLNGGTGTILDQFVEYGKLIPTQDDPQKEDKSFGGWYYASTYGLMTPWDFENGTMPAHDLTLVAKWDDVVEDVTFYEGETELKTIQVTAGEKIPLADIPVTDREGNSFGGWKVGNGVYLTSEDLANDFVVHVTGSTGVKIQGSWTVNSYSVTYDVAGGSPAIPSDTVKYGAKVTAPTTVVTKEDKSFGGWYLASTAPYGLLTEWDFENDTMPAGNITLIAKWDDVEESVSFCDGEEELKTIQVIAGEKIPLAEIPELQKDGHSFAGWKVGNAVYLTSEDLADGYVVHVTGSTGVKVQAAWTINQYTVSFDPNGGDVGIRGITDDYGTEITLPKPVYAHHEFKGWWDGDTQYIGPTMIITENVNLKAKWEVSEYDVNFVIDDTIVETKTVQANQTTSAFVPDTPEGHTFDGWYKDDDYAVKWKFVTDKVTEETFLYGRYLPKDYTVTFDSNGGSVVEAITKPYGTRVTSPEDPKKDNCNFAGWYEKYEDGTISETVFTWPTDPLNRDIVLVAKWNPIQKRVRFFVDGAVDSYQDVNYGEKATPADAPEKEDYEFLGWRLKDSEENFDFDNTPITESIDLYAAYNQTVCTVKFISVELEPYTIISTVKVEKGKKFDFRLFPDADEVTATYAPEGYELKGWYYGDDQLTTFTVVESDLVFAPRFGPIEYYIDIDDGSGSTSPYTVTVNYGDTLEQPDWPVVGEVYVTTPARFLGWTKDGVDYDFSEPVYESFNLVGEWIPVKEVKFVVDNEVVKSIYVNEGATIEDWPAAPQMNSYLFIDWRLEDQVTVYDEDTPVTENVTLYAHFVPELYTVTFNQTTLSAVTFSKDAVTSFAKPTTSAEGSAVTLGEAIAPYFAGPYDQGYFAAVTANLTQEDPNKKVPEGMRVVVDPSAVVVNHASNSDDYTFMFKLDDLDEDKTFTVTFKWDNDPEHDAVYTIDASQVKKGYTVEFLDDYGYDIYDPVLVGEGDTVEAPADPTDDGAVFDCWTVWDDEEDDYVEYDFDTPVTEDIELYASWKTLLGQVEVDEVAYTSYYNYEIDSVEDGSYMLGGVVPVTVKVDKVLQYAGEDPLYTENIAEGEYPAGILLYPPKGLGITKAEYTLTAPINPSTNVVRTDTVGEDDPLELAGDLNDLLKGTTSAQQVKFRVKWYAGDEPVSDFINYEVTFTGDRKLIPLPTLGTAPEGMTIASLLDDKGDVTVLVGAVFTSFDGISVDARDEDNLVFYEGTKVIDDNNVIALLKTQPPAYLDGTVTYGQVQFAYPKEQTENALLVQQSGEDIASIPVTVSATGASQNYNIYPVVAVNKFCTVLYDKNGGTFTDTTSAGNNPFAVVAAGTEVPLKGKDYVTAPAGKAFAGWQITVDGEVVETLQPSETSTLEITGNTEIKAVWADQVTAKFYKTIDENGALVEFAAPPATQTIGKGGVAVEPADAPTRTGYTFVKWAKAVKGTDNKYTAVDFEFTEKLNENTELVAIWEALEAPVTAANLSDGAATGVINPASIVTGYAVSGDTSAKGFDAAIDDVIENAVEVNFDTLAKHGTVMEGYWAGVSVQSPVQTGTVRYYATVTGTTKAGTTKKVNYNGSSAANLLGLENDIDPEQTGKVGVGFHLDCAAQVGTAENLDLTKPVEIEITFVYGTAGEGNLEKATYHIDVQYPDDMIRVTGKTSSVNTATTVYNKESDVTDAFKAAYNVDLIAHKGEYQLVVPAEDTFYSYVAGLKTYFALSGIEVNNTLVTTTGAVNTLTLDTDTDYLLKWTKVVRVQFDGNDADADSTMDPVYVAQNSSYELPENGFTKASHKSKDLWKITRDGTDDADLRAPGYVIEVGTAKVIKLTAQWEQLNQITLVPGYKIGDDPNTEKDETYKTVLEKVYTKEETAVIPEMPSSWTEAPTGYTLVGWSTGENGAGTTYAVGDEVKYETLAGGDQAVTLYALWAPATVEFEQSFDESAKLGDAANAALAKFDLGVTTTGQAVTVTGGVVPYTTGNADFSETTALQSGWYIALSVETPVEINGIAAASNDNYGRIVAAIDAADSKKANVVIHVDGHTTVEATLTLTTAYGDATYTLDLSGVKTGYTVTYKASDDTDADIIPVVVESGAVHTVLGKLFEDPNERTFKNWNLVSGTVKKDDTAVEAGTTLDPDDMITIESDVTLVAQWNDVVTVTIVKGNDEENQEVKAVKGEDFDLPVVSRTGYVLTGWNAAIAPAGTTPVAVRTKTNDAGDTVYYIPHTSMGGDRIATAQWAPEVTVAATTDSKGLLADDAKSLVACNLVPDNGVDNKFAVTSENAIPYSEGNDKFPSATTKAGHYVAVSFTAHESLTVSDATVKFDENNALHSLVVSDKNVVTAVFRADIATLQTNKVFTVSFKIGDDTLTYTFDLSGLKDQFMHVVTFKASGDAEAETVATAQYAKGATIEVPNVTPTKEGHEFSKWTTATDGSSGELDENSKMGDTDVTYYAQYTKKKFTYEADFNGGKVETPNIGTSHGPMERDYGTVLNINKDSLYKNITKPGSVLVGWEVYINGQLTDTLLGTNETDVLVLTDNTKIVAKWKSYLGTLDVAPLSDQANPDAVVVDEDSYEVGYIDADGEFTELKGKTGTFNEEGTAIPITIKAEGLVKHKNATYRNKTGSAVTSPYYWVGLKIAKPADIEGITGYKYKVGVGDEQTVVTDDFTADDNCAIVYFRFDVSNMSNNQKLQLEWTGEGLTGLTATYDVAFDVALLPASYTVTVNKGENYDFVTSATGETVSPATSIDREVAYGGEMKPIYAKAQAGYYFNFETKTKNGITATVSDDLSIVTVSGKPTGSVAEFEFEIPAPVAKTAFAAPTADDVSFEAISNTEATLTNNSDQSMIWAVVSGGANGALAAGESVTLTNLMNQKVYVKFAADDTHLKSDPFIISPVYPTTTFTKASASIYGQYDYVAVANPVDGAVYQAKGLTDSDWREVTPVNGMITGLTPGTYKFRVKPSGLIMGGAETQLTLSQAITPAAVTVTFQFPGLDAKSFTSGADGKVTDEAYATLLATPGVTGWKDQNGMAVAISEDTIYCSNITLYPVY